MDQDSFTLRHLFARPHVFSLLGALLLLAIAYFFESWATLYEIEYLARPTSVYVGDLLLDNLPVVDLSILIVEGALLSIVAGTAFIIGKPRHLLFTLKAIALFVAIRALFVSLTHVGIYPGSITPGVGFFDALYLYLNFQTGFFFSGHTGMPFLMALIFWQQRTIRAIFIFISFVAAIAVLLAHTHYSIDVFAAPFMAFGIYHLAQHFFPRDYALIRKKVHKVLTDG